MQYSISLRPFTDEDLTLFEKWLNAPHVAPWYTPASAWLDELSKRQTTYNWVTHFIIVCDGKPIGFCQYYPYEKGGETWHGNLDITGTYSLDYMIGEADYLKKGLGKQTALLLTKIIFRDTPATSIIVRPEPTNLPSCNTLLASGYTYDEMNKLYIIKK